MLNTTSNQTNLAGERVMEWYIHVVSLIATICLVHTISMLKTEKYVSN